MFWLAFLGLDEASQHAVLERLAGGEIPRRDLLDLATLRERRNEAERPLVEYLAEHGREADAPEMDP